jgi:hypothetical protein
MQSINSKPKETVMTPLAQEGEIMNNTQINDHPPTSKKDRRCRAIPYHHLKNVKLKLAGLRKRQGLHARSPRRLNKCL